MNPDDIQNRDFFVGLRGFDVPQVFGMRDSYLLTKLPVAPAPRATCSSFLVGESGPMVLASVEKTGTFRTDVKLPSPSYQLALAKPSL